MSKSVQIRGVPDDVHRALRVRAAQAGMSLSEYLLREVTGLARRPTLEEIFERTAALRGQVPLNEIVAAIRADRDAGH